MTKCLIALTSIGLLLGQSGSSPALNEEVEFRAIVQRLVADESFPRANRFTDFVFKHDDVAVPILVNGIRARWAKRPVEDAAIPIMVDQVKWEVAKRPDKDDGRAVGTILELVDLATRRAEQPAIDAVGHLCSGYPAGCRCFVYQLLLNARSTEHYFTTASELVRQYPTLGDMTVGYVEFALKSGGGPTDYAQELRERVEKGDKIESDVILPRLAPVSREKVMRALDGLNRN